MEVLNFYKIGSIIPEDAVYIGRYSYKFNLPASKFANPFPVSKEEGGRGSTIKKYKQWLWDQLISEKITKSELLSLDGKNLVCYCKPLDCHGDVIVAAIKWVKENSPELDKRIAAYKTKILTEQAERENVVYKSRRKLP